MPEADDRDREARALFSVLGRAHGLQGVAGIDFEPAAESVATLAGASHVPKPQQLQVLAQAVRSSSTDGSLIGSVDVHDWAESFVHPTLLASERSQARDDLLTRLRQSEPGRDPLGRTEIAHLLEPDPVIAALHVEIGDTLLQLIPDCGASATTIAGYRALSISTLALTRKPFAAFDSIVEPCEWPQCWLQARFFQSMTFVQPQSGPPGHPIPVPEDGWRGTLEEVVDWSLGFGKPDEMHTELDFRYVWPRPGAGAEQFTRAACTYDLARSLDGKVTVDQGYLLVEELLPKFDVRRFQTLKQVFLTDPPFDVAAGDVCGFWSFVSGLIQQGC